MSVRLDPHNIATVLLHVKKSDIVKAFPFVSKMCQRVMLTLKVNPKPFLMSPREIIRHFPNITTMVVDDLTEFKEADSLPDTLTTLIVENLDFEDLTEEHLQQADRVVEIRGCSSNEEHPANFTLFPHLERLTLNYVPDSFTPPKHKLRHLRVVSLEKDDDVFSLFPLDCAEQITCIFGSRKALTKAKARQLPPNVRVFCAKVGECVMPEDFYSLRFDGWGECTFSENFGADDLRAFNEFPLPFLEMA